jgi:hypothetical protein
MSQFQEGEGPPIRTRDRTRYRTSHPKGPAATLRARQCGTNFEVFIEGQEARVARGMCWLPRVGEFYSAGKGSHRVEGIVTRVEPGELPRDDFPGRFCRVYLAPGGRRPDAPGPEGDGVAGRRTLSPRNTGV